ncbi:MAG: hypothetical protein LBB94_08090 [Clostridiales bacterium]|jgi:hypothetical protein|nr:hypothetical protein [Clostridiales bacterium]
MQIIFTRNGYTVDDGSLTIAELYHCAFDSAPPEDAALRFLADIAKSLVDGLRATRILN